MPKFLGHPNLVFIYIRVENIRETVHCNISIANIADFVGTYVQFSPHACSFVKHFAKNHLLLHQSCNECYLV